MSSSIPGRLIAKAHAALARAHQSLTSTESAVIISQIARMEQIAARLGFELVSTRLEIYGRRRAARAAGTQARASVVAEDAPAEGSRR